jgi:hypothetical protein
MSLKPDGKHTRARTIRKARRQLTLFVPVVPWEGVAECWAVDRTRDAVAVRQDGVTFSVKPGLLDLALPSGALEPGEGKACRNEKRSRT